jgi:SP family general alpha glucoside:H+ symporter-like MFS transporter
MGEAAAFDVNLALNSMYIVGTLTSWACESTLALSGIQSLHRAVLYRYGRRTVYIAGQLFMGGILGVIGILGIFSKNPNVAYGIGSLLILLNFGYNISVGPLCKSRNTTWS